MLCVCICLSLILVGGPHDSHQSRQGAVISRSVTGRRSFITLRCPKNHVFANVKFKLADNSVTKYDKCSKSSLAAQKKCRWHSKCRVSTKVKTLNCTASAIQLWNLKCVPRDSFINICKSAETGAVWITNYGRLKRNQMKGQCRRIKKSAFKKYRFRRGIGRNRTPVKGVVTQENGIIQDYVGWQKKTYQFSCPKKSVISSIDLQLSNATCRRTSKTSCFGWSPEFLLQQNNCYWKESCKISWDRPQVILKSNNPACIGMQGTLFSTREHQCMPKKRIYDICTKSEAKGKRGLLRSHNDYPWNYQEGMGKCTTLIKIKHRGALYLRLNDVDLDTQRDELSASHVARRSSCQLKQSSLQEGVWLYGGYVKVQFTVHKNTVSGRGFVLSYKNVKERLPRHKEKNQEVCSKVTNY